ncbi:MAG: ATP-binding protein [Firmicutes bacterium]|nr:ATP-binding protein [Bacillota bacterium]
MATYLNPGNESFRVIRNGKYVDKTGLVDYINGTIDTPFKMTCFSRARRFGKSFAAKMLCSYYDKTCDSHELFDDLEVAKCLSYEKHINKYDVIYLDMTWFISTTEDIKHIVGDIQKSVIDELNECYPNARVSDETSLPRALLKAVSYTGDKFIVIIDEWDALFREAKDDDTLQREYVQLLRGLFKGGAATDKSIAAAYMTGILPIKKYGTQSALTDFKEYTMVEPLALSEYVGFTEDEVKSLCKEYNMDFDEMKKWYDGYAFSEIKSVYNPNSVMNAIKFRKFRSYWTSSETYESLKSYIGMNFNGLKDAIVSMLGGEKIRVNTVRFQNDVTSFESRDDVLTLLVHLGYLAYDETERGTYIPNLEVSDSFEAAVEGREWGIVEKAIADSDKLLDATIKGDADAVAAALEKIHESNFSILKYNDENSLSCAVTIAYYTARSHYRIIREFPSGRGFADIAFLPYKNTDKPAMIVELKYNKDADTAIRQIKEKRYDGKMREYCGSDNLILVGINYDRETKKHSCLIERI